MFTNYQNVPSTYQPNNLTINFPQYTVESKLVAAERGKPFEEYNVKGELEGFFWRYGETLNLEFNLDGEIVVENDAIILTGKGTTPDIYTKGYIGQRLYNVSDLTSFTCTSIINGNYIWEKDTNLTYPEIGESVYVSAEDYLKDKIVEVTLYNFRFEPIYSTKFDGTTSVILTIDKELSSKLTRGIYYCSINVYNETVNMMVFEPTDCKLLVK